MNNSIYKNEKLAKYSWFHLGGPAEIFFKPKSIEDLKNFLVEQKSKNKKIHILGAGSNTLFRDSGFDGIIIRLGKNFSFCKLIEKNKIEVGAGTLDKKVSDFAKENNIQGFEFLSCIPGTIGGAIKMNSGCYGHDMSQIFYSLKGIDLNGNIKIFKKEDIKFLYREINLQKDLIFLSAIFFGKTLNKNEIQEKQNSMIIKKKTSQPSKIKTCGSTFKNPKDKKAWKLIELSNCKNLRIGGASISSQHCNFFINDGSASSKDIENLIDEVKKKVMMNTGIELELEIKIVGKR